MPTNPYKKKTSAKSKSQPKQYSAAHNKAKYHQQRLQTDSRAAEGDSRAQAMQQQIYSKLGQPAPQRTDPNAIDNSIRTLPLMAGPGMLGGLGRAAAGAAAPGAEAAAGAGMKMAGPALQGAARPVEELAEHLTGKMSKVVDDALGPIMKKIDSLATKQKAIGGSTRGRTMMKRIASDANKGSGKPIAQRAESTGKPPIALKGGKTATKAAATRASSARPGKSSAKPAKAEGGSKPQSLKKSAPRASKPGKGSTSKPMMKARSPKTTVRKRK